MVRCIGSVRTPARITSYPTGNTPAAVLRAGRETFDDLHNGSNGFSSNMKVNGASVNDKAGPDGKTCKAVMEPVLQHGPENRWGVWVTGFGDFVNVDGDGNAQVISTYVNYDGQLRSVRKWSRSFFLLVRASFSPRF